MIVNLKELVTHHNALTNIVFDIMGEQVELQGNSREISFVKVSGHASLVIETHYGEYEVTGAYVLDGHLILSGTCHEQEDIALFASTITENLDHTISQGAFVKNTIPKHIRDLLSELNEFYEERLHVNFISKMIVCTRVKISL